MYTSLLSLLTVLSSIPMKRRDDFTYHLAFVLASTWFIYAYRDLWPLATFNLSPRDAQEGVLLWVKIGVLTIAAVVVPLCMPRQYVPVDPQVSLRVANFLQQSLSILIV